MHAVRTRCARDPMRIIARMLNSSANCSLSRTRPSSLSSTVAVSWGEVRAGADAGSKRS